MVDANKTAKELILYQSENTNKSIEVLYDNEDFWLTQKTMAELLMLNPIQLVIT